MTKPFNKIMKDLTPEMEKMVEYSVWHQNGCDFLLYDRGVCDCDKQLIKAMQAVRKEAQLELIEEMKDFIVREMGVDCKHVDNVKLLLTTKEESLKE